MEPHPNFRTPDPRGLDHEYHNFGRSTLAHHNHALCSSAKFNEGEQVFKEFMHFHYMVNRVPVPNSRNPDP